VRQLLNLTTVNAEGEYVQQIAPNNIVWSSNVNINVLTGSLNYLENNSSRRFDIVITPFGEYDWKDPNFSYTLDFGDIRYFANVLPFEGTGCLTGTCTNAKFYADAVIHGQIGDDSNALIFYRVVIEIKSYTAGLQDQIQPVASRCVKTIVPSNKTIVPGNN
jgi:hypothetical protein